MKTNNLPVNGLNFDQIRENLVAFLKDKPAYKDWNFQASGISSILDLLAYNTHYLGVYVKMLMDESFVDSAHTREALLSAAKRTGYTPKGKRAARAEVQLSVTIPKASDPPNQVVHIERGLTFTGNNSTQDKRVFTILNDVLISNKTEGTTSFTYTSEPFTIYQGTLETYRFLVDSNQVNQRFIVRDPNIDISTLRVDVAIGEAVEQFNLADDVFELNSESKVFFVTTNEDGLYQVFFGDDVFGVKPPNGAEIRCHFISTAGETGNGAKSFIFNPGNTVNAIAGASYSTQTTSISSGGMEKEDTESLRFTIPHHYRRQNRIHTESDYRAVLLSEFRNIDSLNVWGGERNGQRQYGKVFVSIKPKFSDSLTASARQEISDAIIKKYGSVGTDIEFVDPEFIEVDLDVFGRVDTRKTNDGIRTIEGSLTEEIQTYNEQKLNKFDTLFSNLDLLEYLRDTDQSIVTLYTVKRLRKKTQVLHGSTSMNQVSFVNPINAGAVSSPISYLSTRYVLRDHAGHLWLEKESDGTRILDRPSGTVNYEDGTISFTLPSTARVVGYEKTRVGIIEFTCSPSLPDIDTRLNKIVRIAKTKVKLNS